MKKQYKLLLHIGLHKTATTSFQHNICLPLHKKGRINFLGAVRNNKKTIHYPLAKIFNDIQTKKLTKDESCQLKTETEQLLSKEKLNVLSEENISTTLMDPVYFSTMLKQLQFIFSSCDIHCLLSLRKPVDYIFSLYVEMYRWIYHSQKKKDTFIKFTQHLFNDPYNAKYTLYFYEQYLSIVDQYFKNKTVLLFEDLIHDKKTYFSTLASLLGIEESYIRDGFLRKTLHITKKKKKGYLNSPVVKTLYEWLAERITPHRWLFLKNQLLFVRSLCKKFLFFNRIKPNTNIVLQTKLDKNLTKKLSVRSLCKKFLESIKFNTKVKLHPKPDENLTKKLSALVAIKNLDSFAKQHHLAKKKLVEYGYGK